MNHLLSVIFDGLTVGVIYSLLGVAIVLIYQSTGVVNVAQGELATLSTFVVWQCVAWGLPLLAGALLGFLAAVALGVIIQVLIVRRLTKDDHLVVLVASIGLFLAINQLTGWIWTPVVRTLRSPFGEGRVSVGGASISYHTLGSLAVLAIVALVLYLLMMRTRLGLGLRAAATAPEWSSLNGLDVQRHHMFGWGISLGVGSIAGLLAAPVFFLEPQMMYGAVLYAFAGVALGGFDSVPGAMLGGLLLGVTEALVASYVGFVGSELKIIVPLVLMGIILLTRPSGLFGSREVARV